MFIKTYFEQLEETPRERQELIRGLERTLAVALNRNTEARQVINKALEIAIADYPTHLPSAQYNLGALYLGLGDYTKAEIWLRQASQNGVAQANEVLKLIPR